jgi:hypothetical protein
MNKTTFLRQLLNASPTHGYTVKDVYKDGSIVTHIIDRSQTKLRMKGKNANKFELCTKHVNGTILLDKPTLIGMTTGQSILKNWGL